jgi:hypothetical protein
LRRTLVAHQKKGGTERLGDFKSPIVTQLWSRRSTAKELEMDCSPPSPPVERKPSESRTTVTYEFTKDPFLCQSYENPWGFFRKGKLLEDMDALAGNIAFKHCERDGKVGRATTSCMSDKSCTESNFRLCFLSHTPGPLASHCERRQNSALEQPRPGP